MKDNLSDMITRIRNAQHLKLKEVSLFWPTPKFCLKVLELLKKEGYIRGYKYIFENNKIITQVLLKYTPLQVPVIKKIKRVSTPGKRIYVKSKSFWKVNNGLGAYIISTTKGLYTDSENRFLNLGGEVLFYIE